MEKKNPKAGDKLWEVRIEEEEDSYRFYLVSSQKPLVIVETPLGKFRRMFSLFNESYPPLQLPVFYVSPRQKATVEQTQKMHGFNLQQLTPRHIILWIDNPQKKFLYEITFFSKKVKSFFKKEYILAFNKKEAVEYSSRFRPTYQVKVKKAKKMDCYPIVSITEDRIVLNRAV